MDNTEQNKDIKDSKYWFDMGKVYYLQEKDYQCISALKKAMLLALKEEREAGNA